MFFRSVNDLLYDYIWFYYFSEPFIEAVPTVFILLLLMFRDEQSKRGKGFFFGSEHVFFGLISKDRMIYATFSISVITASLGISKFVKVGPCQFVPSDKWHCGIFLVFLNVMATICAKGCVLGFSVGGGPRPLHPRDTLIIWLLTCILPNLILVSKIMLWRYYW